MQSRLRPISAGVVSALVGFTSAFAVVLTGLAGVGADHDQAASGLLAVTVTMGLACILLAWWSRMPITVAWSTPGAALIAAVVEAARLVPGDASWLLITGPNLPQGAFDVRVDGKVLLPNVQGAPGRVTMLEPITLK